MEDTKAIDRIQTALTKFSDNITQNGGKIPKTLTFDFVIGVEKLLTSDKDKMVFLMLMHQMLEKPEEKAKALNRGKELYSKNGNNDAIFINISAENMAYVGGASFVSQISDTAYQSFIDNNVDFYLRSKSFFGAQGLDPNRMPSKAAIEKIIRNLPEQKYEIGMIDAVDDPQLKIQIAMSLSGNRLHAKEMLERELEKKEKGLPYENDILQKAFITLANFDPNKPTQRKAGEAGVDTQYFQMYGEKLYSPTQMDQMLLTIARIDPAAGLTLAVAKYPKEANSIPLYLAALPHANEFLNDPKATHYVIKMLNTLEPSQYAGTSYRLIPDKDVFKLLDGATATQLYDLITDNQSQKTGYTYTQGTYNEISKRFYERLKSEGKNFSDIVNSSPKRSEDILKFVWAADAYRRTDPLTKATTYDDHHLIINKLFAKSENSYDISTISNFIKSLPKGSPILPYIESSIITTALEGDNYVKADMGILAKWYALNSPHPVSQENKAFFDKVKADPSFDVPPLNSIPSQKLLDAAGRNFQMHVFYNDKDGTSSFESLSASLKADKFTVKKQNDFLIFTKEQKGKTIEILVSPPEKDGAAISQITDYVKSKNGVISLLTGRGHSHHMEKAVELITPDIKVVSLGGCWGHVYTANVLEKSPDAHILATTGVGRMSINNFNTRWINNQILSGQDLSWGGLRTEWNRIKGDKSLAADMEQYVSPDENIFLLYQRRQNELYDIINKANEEALKTPSSKLNDSFMQSVREASRKTAPQDNPAAQISSVMQEPAQSLT